MLSLIYSMILKIRSLLFWSDFAKSNFKKRSQKVRETDKFWMYKIKSQEKNQPHLKVISLCRSKKETKRVHKSYEITMILAARCYKLVFPNIFSHKYPFTLITKAQVPFNNTKVEECLLHLAGNRCCTSYSEIQIYISYIINTFIMCFRAVSEMKSGISPSLYPTEIIKLGQQKFSSWSKLVYTDLADIQIYIYAFGRCF